MKRNKILAALALIVLAAFWLSGCDSAPTAPDPLLIAPSPSPTPDPKTDVTSCKQVDVRITGYNGAGNPDLVFGVGEMFSVIAHPLNEAGAVLPSNCRASTFATWIPGGTASCEQFGDRFSTSAAFWCIEPGSLSLTVRHGPYTSSWNGRVIR